MMNDSSSVEEVEWKKTVVRLDNRLEVDKSLLKQIVEKAGLAERRLLLICDDKNGFKSGNEILRGAAFAEKDLDIAVLKAGNKECIGQHNIDARDEWDYAVYIPLKSGETLSEFKPYFVSVLGHELTHVWIMSQDLSFHRCTSWLFGVFNDRVVKCKLKKYEVPWEKHCHKKGKHIALSIDDELKVQKALHEYADFLSKCNSEHSLVINWLCGLECSDVNAENILSIKKATQALCGQWKKPLLQHWGKERDLCRKNLAQRFELPDFI